jgi:FkbM family methyltransferase
MQLSYAQNLEDYHLDLVFADLATGTYVDVGGGHPVADNVSFWFYLKGWRGLVVEPQEGLAAAYRGIRPRDAVFAGLAGDRDGEMEFHAVEGLHGLSSTLRVSAESARQYGARYATSRKPVRRLSALIEEAGLGAIDFLKIDVEGAEAQVLAGLDLARHRPRVVVVEAVNPSTAGAAEAPWHETLAAAGYRFAFFDNLNRFYVAEEEAELAQRFPPKPAAWDAVEHLWDCGRAHARPDHPDAGLAQVLVHGLMASLPGLDPRTLQTFVERGLAAMKLGGHGPDTERRLRGTAELPRAPMPTSDLAALLATDDLRAALGRIASMYDGGHIVE